MTDSNGHFNYDISVTDGFTDPLERFAEKLREVEGAFDDLKASAAGGVKVPAAQNNAATQAIEGQIKATNVLTVARRRATLGLTEDAKIVQQINKDQDKARQEEIAGLRKITAAREASNRRLAQINATEEADAVRRNRAFSRAVREEAASRREANQSFQRQARAEEKAAAAQEAAAAAGEAAQERLLIAQRRVAREREALAERVRVDQAAQAADAKRNQERLLLAQQRTTREREALAERVRVFQDAEFRQSITNIERERTARQAAFRATPQGQAAQIALRADKRQNVTDILARQGLDANGIQQLTRGEQIINSINKAALGAAKSVGSLVVAFVAFRILQGIGDIFRGITSEVINYNAKIETATLGIASLLTAVTEVRDATGASVKPAEALALAQEEASRQVVLLRIEALKTSATFEDLSAAFQSAIAPGKDAGLTVDQIRKFSIQASQAAGALGLAQDQLAQEIRASLTGEGSLRNTRFFSSGLIKPEDIKRAREAGTLFELLQERFGAFSQAAEASSKTFDVIFSNLKDSFEQVLGPGSIALFNEVKGLLQDITNSLVTVQGNQIIVNPQVEETVRAIADGFQEIVKEIRQADISLADVVGFARLFGEILKSAAPRLREAAEGTLFILGGLSKIIEVLVDLRTAVEGVFFDGITQSTDKAVDLAISRLAVFSAQAKVLLLGLVAAVDPTDSFQDSFIQAGFELATAEGKAKGLKDALEGVSREADRGHAIFIGMADSVEATRVAIDSLNKESEKFSTKREVGAAERPEVSHALKVIQGERALVLASINDAAKEGAAGIGKIIVANEQLSNLQRAELQITAALENVITQKRLAAYRLEGQAILKNFQDARSAHLEAGVQTQADSAAVLDDKLRALEREAELQKQKLLDSAGLNVDLASQFDSIAETLALKKEDLKIAHERAAAEREQANAEKLRVVRAQALSAQASALEGLAQAGPNDIGRLGDAARQAAGAQARALRIQILNDENKAQQEAITFENAKLGAVQRTTEELQAQFDLMNQINESSIAQINRQASLTPERQGGTQTVGQEFAGGINIDVIGATISTAQSMVQSFTDFTADALFNAFNPDSSILDGLSNLLENLGKQILQLIAQIIIQKLILLAIDTAITAVSGGAAAGVGGIVGTLGSALTGAHAHGGQAGTGPMVLSPMSFFKNARGYAHGGRPAGLAAGDTIPAWLDPREWVIQPSAVARAGADTLARINAGMFDPMALRAATKDSPRVTMAVPAGSGRAIGGPAPMPSGRSSGGGVVEAFIAPSEQAAARLREGGLGADLRSMRRNRAAFRAALGI